MKAVILAGGKGTRLEPYTTVFPKPLVPIGDRPILDIIIRQLVYYGFKDIIFTVGHLAELIQAYFKNGTTGLPRDIKLTYIKEQTPTGTAGSLRSIPGLRKAFLVMNGDLLTTLNYNKLAAYHREKGGILTVAMHKKHIKIDLGVMETNSDGFLNSYIEKPKKIYDVSMGIYVYEPEALSYIEPNSYLDFPQLIKRLILAGERVAVYPSDDFWLDIGNHDDFAKAQVEFKRQMHRFLPSRRFSRKRSRYVEDTPV